MEHRNGLVVGFALTQATGMAEREAAVDLLDEVRERGFHPTTLAGDKNYDTSQCVAELHERGVTAARGAEHQRTPQRN